MTDEELARRMRELEARAEAFTETRKLFVVEHADLTARVAKLEERVGKGETLDAISEGIKRNRSSMLRVTIALSSVIVAVVALAVHAITGG